MARKPAAPAGKKTRRVIAVNEDSVHKSVVAHLNLRCSPHCFWFHVPNGGSRHLLEAVKLKAMGTKAGVADIVLVIRGRTYFLELKGSKGKPSLDQIAVKALVQTAGGTYEIAKGIDEALGYLESWGAFSVGRPL